MTAKQQHRLEYGVSTLIGLVSAAALPLWLAIPVAIGALVVFEHWVFKK